MWLISALAMEMLQSYTKSLLWLRVSLRFNLTTSSFWSSLLPNYKNDQNSLVHHLTRSLDDDIAKKLKMYKGVYIDIFCQNKHQKWNARS